MNRRLSVTNQARADLWREREDYLPHLIEHHCPATHALHALCATAGWTVDSYVLAVFFDRADLLVEVTK